MTASEGRHIQLMKGTAGNRLGILFITFFVCFIVVAMVQSLLAYTNLSARNSFLIVSTLQNLLVFVFASWLAAFLTTSSPAGYLGFERKVGIREFIGAFILLVFILPAMNALISWNENLSLPASMATIEETIRGWEDAAADTTKMILGDTSAWGLISGILVVGLLTGFSEEMFFRAGVQKTLTAARCNPHVAVWVTAFIFSTIHFQFFGFFPRMLLGAVFGYLYYYTGSIWIPAFAHALNNSSVVVTEWLIARGTLNSGIDQIGVEGPYRFIWIALSIALTIIFITALWKRFFPIADRKQ